MRGRRAGLYFALLMKLQDPGHDVTVFERNGTNSTYGWGVTFGADLMAELYSNDPLSAREIGQAAFHWVNQVVDVEGKQVQRASGDGYSIKQQRLLDIMAERAKGLGVRLEFDYEVMAPSELLQADLIVACDGVNSRTRLAARSLQTHVRINTNKYLWLGTSKVFKSFMYAFVPTGSGWVWAYAYGVDTESSTFIVECSPKTWPGP